MANDPMYVKLGVVLGIFNSGLKTARVALSNTNSIVKTSFGGWYNRVRKVNQAYVNLNKDLNRSNQGLSKFSKLSGGLFKGGMTSLGGVLGIGSTYALGSALANAIQSSFDMIETQNLFNVSLRSTAVETENVINKMSELYGLDPSNLKNSVGTYSLLARSMGLSAEQSQKLAINTSQLAVDLSSLMNVPIHQVMADLRSGLLGQSETVYKYGVDVTEAALKSEALAQGITKSVRNMSQGEKLALRYNVIIKQTALAHGDFARTLDQPANQLKILGERVVTLGRSIGSVFMGAIGAILPYLNAFVRLLIEGTNAIAAFFGYEAPTATNLSETIGGISENADDAADSISGIGEAIKNATLGLDELNVLNKTVSSIGSGIGTGSILEGLDLVSYDNLMDTIKSKSSEIFQNLKAGVEGFLTAGGREGLEALGRAFENVGRLITNIKTLYQNFKLFLEKNGITFDPVAYLGENFNKLSRIIEKITDALADLFEGDYIGFANSIVDAFKIMFPEFDIFSDKSKTGREKLYELIKTPFNPLTFAFLTNMEFGKVFFDFINKNSKDSRKLLADFILIPFFPLITGFGGTAVAVGVFASVIKDYFKAIGKSAQSLMDALGNLVDGWKAFLSLDFNRVKKLEKVFKENIKDAMTLDFSVSQSIKNALKVSRDVKISDFKMAGYASGGLPTTGEMFIAREAGPELVGSIGGKTAVVNNDQIVESVASGVYKAVLEAIGQQSEKPMIIELDGEVIYRNQQKIATGRGTSFGMGVFAR